MVEPAAPVAALTLAYWLHMLATVVWIGGLVALSLFVLPAARKTLDPTAFSALLSSIRARLNQVGWFCLVILGVTGMFQMSAHPAYQGFLAISGSWAVAILTKHLVIVLMIVTSAYVTWGILPALQRSAMLRAIGKPVNELQVERWQRREIWLLRLNILLSMLVLALTAWARTSS